MKWPKIVEMNPDVTAGMRNAKSRCGIGVATPQNQEDDHAQDDEVM